MAVEFDDTEMAILYGWLLDDMIKTTKSINETGGGFIYNEARMAKLVSIGDKLHDDVKGREDG